MIEERHVSIVAFPQCYGEIDQFLYRSSGTYLKNMPIEEKEKIVKR
jgi:hypothetical protein